MDAQEPQFRPSRRGIWMTVAIVTLLFLIVCGQAIRSEAIDDIAAALTTTPMVGPPAMEFKGMRFSGEHLLVVMYELKGFAGVSGARWHARPWGSVELVNDAGLEGAPPATSQSVE